MPELEKITIRGFRSIREISDLQLSPINILIGANGSGKSNFISIFSFLQNVKEGRLQDFVGKAGGADRILHFGAKYTDEIEIHLQFREQVNQYKLVLEQTSDGTLYPSEEEVYFWKKSEYAKPYERTLAPFGGEAGISRNDLGLIGQYVREHLDRWRVYHFHDTSSSSPMKRQAKVEDNRYLRADGSNLAAFLYMLSKKYPSSYRMICASIRSVFPVFVDFVLNPSTLNESFIGLEWKHRNTDEYFDVSSLSDGTLRFIALATLFLQPPELRPSVVLVDEPELGLHPFAVGILASLVKQASVETQVILSTQSPFLLDHFSPEDVVVADLIDGATKLTRPEKEHLVEWLDEYSLGQLWEKNQLGGRPGGMSGKMG